MIRIAALFLPLALVAARGDDPLAGRVPGPPAQCLELSRVDGPTVIDTRTILYRQSGKRIWRAELSAECPALEPFSTIIAEVYGNQLCRGDRFRVRSPNSIIPSGYCRFERFVPYDKPPTARTG